MEDRSRSHPACQAEEQLRRDLRTERTRGSGPGGQHRNRVETEIRLTHLPTGIRAFAGERRSQHRNHQVALFRLRLNLALGYRTPLLDADFVAPGAFQPSSRWLSRVRGGRIAINPEHADFPAILAEALDTLELYEDELGATAEALRLTRSQLVKLLAKAPAALHALNQRRQGRGERPLRS